MHALKQQMGHELFENVRATIAATATSLHGLNRINQNYSSLHHSLTAPKLKGKAIAVVNYPL
jgi:hypothetical protein